MNRIVTRGSAALSKAMDDPGKILLFDGVCNLCNGLVKFIIKRDHRHLIRFAPLQSEYARSALKRFNRDADEINTVVYISDENYFLKSVAILNLLKDLGGAWRILYGFIIIPRFIRDAVYDLVVRHRYRIFGKRELCMVPTPEIMDRFVV